MTNYGWFMMRNILDGKLKVKPIGTQHKDQAYCFLNLDLHSYACIDGFNEYSVLKGDGTDPIGQAVWYSFEYTCKKGVQ